MDDLRSILEQLTDERELDYVLARSHLPSDSAALQEVGYSSSTWYTKDAERRAYLNDVALKLKRNRTLKAAMVMEKAAEDAAKAIVDLMYQAEKDHVRLKAAQDVLDRTGGKPTQKIEQTVEERRRPTYTVDDLAHVDQEIAEWELTRFGSDSTDTEPADTAEAD